MGVFIHKKGCATIAPWRFNPLVSPAMNIEGDIKINDTTQGF